MQATRSKDGRSRVHLGLVRFTSTYLLVLVLPLTAFVTYYLIGVRTDLERRLDRDVTTRIENAAQLIGAELHQLQKLIQYIQVSSAFRVRSYDNPLEIIAVQARLSELVVTNRLIQIIAYCPFGAPRIYTSESPRFAELFEGETGIVAEQLMGLLDAGQGPAFVRTNGSRSGSVALVSSIPSDSPFPRAIVVIELVPRALSSVLSAALPAYEGVAIEFLHDGQQVEVVGDASLLSAHPGDAESRVTREIVLSPFGTLRVVARAADVYADLTRSSRLLGVIVVVVLLVCLPVIYTISLSDRSPVRQLAALLGTGTQRSNGSILSTATLELRRLQWEVAELERASDDSITLQRRQLLEQILSGTIEDASRLVDRAEGLGIALRGRRLRVLVGDDYAEAGAAPYESFRQVLTESLCCDVHDVPNVQDGRSTFLVLSSKPVADDLYLRIFATARESTSAQITVAASGEFVRVEDAPRAFLAAKSAIEYRFVLGVDQFLLAEEVLERENCSYDFPSDAINRVRAYAENLDVESIAREVASTFRRLQSARPSLFVARCVVYDMITAIVESLARRDLSSDTYWKYIGALDLADIKTVADMSRAVVQVATDLVEVTGKLEETPGATSPAFAAVVRYVEDRVFDPMVGAKMVAAAFEMSVSNFSHQFKSHTGQTFSQFVFARRLARATELLTETDASLAEVVHETGFGNVSSFIRRFRRVTGRTPIDYRRHARSLQVR